MESSILNTPPELIAFAGFDSWNDYENEIYAIDGDGDYTYNFKNPNLSVKQYKVFMRKTGLFDLIENHIVNNLVDYATGVETGLDSNGRKNRGGHQMEDLVES